MQVHYLEIVTKESTRSAPRTPQRTGCSSASRTPGSATHGRPRCRAADWWGCGRPARDRGAGGAALLAGGRHRSGRRRGGGGRRRSRPPADGDPRPRHVRHLHPGRHPPRPLAALGRMMRTTILVVAALVAGGGRLSAQETGFLNRSVVVDGAEYLYQVYVPRDTDDPPCCRSSWRSMAAANTARTGFGTPMAGSGARFACTSNASRRSSCSHRARRAALPGSRPSADESRWRPWTNPSPSSTPTCRVST